MQNNQPITYRMRLFCTLLLILLPFSKSLAQNTFSLNTTTGLNFNFNTASSLENDNVKQNAFIVTVRPKSSNISVYARIYYYSAPYGFVPGSMNLELDYKSVNSTTGVSNLVTSPFILSTSDQRLFSISRRTTTFNFYYGLICTAPGYSTATGHYNFTLMFTMTSP